MKKRPSETDEAHVVGKEVKGKREEGVDAHDVDDPLPIRGKLEDERAEEAARR